MKPKNILTVGLLLFVAASVVVLAARSLRENPQAAGTDGQPEEAAPEHRAADASPPLSEKVIAYYFHGNVRCPTCRSIEAYAREAVQSGFPEQLEDRRIEWRVVNYEQPGNEHFLTDYKLAFPTVILVEVSGGSQAKWKNLDRVWQLVGDKWAFVEYVQQETRSYLEGKE